MGKKSYNSFKTDPFFGIKKKKINFVKFVATKKDMTTNFFSPLYFVPVFGSEIRDPRSGIRDPGSEIRDPGSGIRDPGSGIRDGLTLVPAFRELSKQSGDDCRNV